MKQTSRRAARNGKKKTGSLWIPAIAGLVLVAVIVALIVSIESRGPTADALSRATAEPQPTSQLPFPNVPRLSVEETQAGMDAGEVLLVDVRSRESYDSLHAAGAVSIPEDEMAARLNELPRDREIVLYCT